MESLSRRDFLNASSATLATAVTVAISTQVGLPVVEAQRESSRKLTTTVGKKFAMVIDVNKCIACDACVASCKAENNVPVGVFRTWVEKHEGGDFPNIKIQFVPKLCFQCDNPPCVSVCPVDATFKRADGLVLVDYEKCIGCGYCIAACPYGMRYFDRVRNVVDKCTFCVQRLEQGLAPACVETCVGGARIFGDMNDPESPVRRVIDREPAEVRRPELGTKPQVFFVGLDSTIVR